MNSPSLPECEQVLNAILFTVSTPKSTNEQLQGELSSFSHLLQHTLHSEHLRAELARSELIWRLIRLFLEVGVPNDPQTLSLRVRLLRAVLILGRNLLSMDREVAERLQIRTLVVSFISRVQDYDVEDQIKRNVVVSGFELLANFSVNLKRHQLEALDEVISLFASSSDQWDKEVLHPAFAYIENVFSDTDVLYEALSKGKGKQLIGVILDEYEKLDLVKDLDSYEALIIRIFTKLVLHESFLKFITLHNTPEDTVRYLKVSQAIITSKKDWEVFELTVVLSWNFELFQKTVVEIQQYFSNNGASSDEQPTVIYGKISSVMDVFSTLSHLEHSRKFLLSYKGVELFVSLLGLLHKNIKPKSKLKDTEKQDQRIRYPRDFPHIKCMIIETLTSLVHENFEVQEQIREIHGLELILSNCIIDDNEPFIKERAIVCIRFLLKDNQKNQDFVAQMEAKQVIPNEALDEAGFEVEIIDGKVQMKRKAKIQEIIDNNGHQQTT